MKGLIFSLEVMIAIALFSSFILFLFLVTFERTSPYSRYERIHLLAEDGIKVLTELRISDLKGDVPVIRDLLESEELTQDDLNTSVIEVIGTFWATGKPAIAENITKSVLQQIMPLNVNYGFYIGDELIFNSSDSEASQISTANRLISGFQPGEVIKGFVSKAELEKIRSKQTSSYTYFGGFVGQGNLTVYIRDIPTDANITSIYMELNSGNNFSLYINGEFCENFYKSAAGDFPVDKWVITDPNCLNGINKGSDNRFDFNFTQGDIMQKFIGGGYLKITYDTAQMVPSSINTMRYYFPGIDGIINIYDSFYVPGDITSMKIHLNFFNEHETYLKIGGETVFFSTGNNTTQVVDISNDILSTKLDYTKISSKTVPIRMGTNLTLVTGEGNADVILITDLSGSMLQDMTGSYSGVNEIDDCSDPRIYNDNDTQKLSVAKCLDKEFINIILSYEGNRIGLAAYDGSSNEYLKRQCAAGSTDFQYNPLPLENEINHYKASGSTCTSCSLYWARHMFDVKSKDPSRKRFVVLMTDGLANTLATSPPSWSKCVVGSYCQAMCGDVYCEDAGDQTIDEACSLAEDFNATIYAVGFGPIVSCPIVKDFMENVSNCGNGKYYPGQNATELLEIYREIAKEILTQSFVRQIANVTAKITNTTLFPDSYIEFEYIPETPTYSYGEVSLKFETKPFGSCNGSFFVPEQLAVDDIRTTSYSSDFWTKDLFVNNSVTSYNWLNVYNLTLYGVEYVKLGDPFYIQFPANYVKSNETNHIRLVLGFTPVNESSKCSGMDRAIYTARFRAITSYSPPLPEAKGDCVIVYYDKDHDGIWDGSVDVNVGPDTEPPCISVEDLNTSNSIHYTFLELLDILNFVKHTGLPGSETNPIDIEITEELIVDVRSLSNIPSLWGPLRFRLDVWI